jgi:short-subunit dehydrogenase involved in D-alanine esterification of teichoic acids
MKLTSNTILITGGASGIGYELTKQLAALGNTILITGRDQAKLDRAKAAFPNIHTFRSDVSDPEAIATLFDKVTKQFPELSILINNAGIMREINVHDKAGSLEDITREIETNLSGPIRMVKQFLPHLKAQSDMKGVSIMTVEGMVKVAVKGMQTDRFEIRPGQANQLKMMSRLAPGFILKQMSRSVDRMLRTHN